MSRWIAAVVTVLALTFGAVGCGKMGEPKKPGSEMKPGTAVKPGTSMMK